MGLRAALWTLVVSVAFAGSATMAAPTQCMSGLGPALVAGGFSGSTDCKRDRLSLRFIGEVRKFGRTFRIYANRYRLKPPCPECAVHGGQRIIFMENGRYIGQYRADFTTVIVRNGNLILAQADVPDAKSVMVSFSAKGPARSQWDGGEVLEFFR
jgi:hypothetical protein